MVPANENLNLLVILGERYGPELVIVLSVVYIKSESASSEKAKTKALYCNFLGLSLPNITCCRLAESLSLLEIRSVFQLLPTFRLLACRSTGQVCRGRGQYLLHCLLLPQSTLL